MAISSVSFSLPLPFSSLREGDDRLRPGPRFQILSILLSSAGSIGLAVPARGTSLEEEADAAMRSFSCLMRSLTL